MYLVCALAGQDRLNRSGSSWLLTLSSLVKSQKYFHRLLFLQLFRPAQQALGWSDSPRFRGGLSVSCSSCRGILLRLPWLRLLGESERCDHGAGPEVTPSWALRYSYISPTCWLRPPTPRFNYLSLLTTQRTLRQPGRIRLWLISKLFDHSENFCRGTVWKIFPGWSKMFCKLWTQANTMFTLQNQLE